MFIAKCNNTRESLLTYLFRGKLIINRLYIKCFYGILANLALFYLVVWR